MAIRLRLAYTQFGTVVSAYTPTLQTDDELKELFYSALDKSQPPTKSSPLAPLMQELDGSVKSGKE